jgi:DNA end-binding protein Ku
MPQMIWRGAVSFGLVHVPVRLFPATRHTQIGFGLLDRRSMDQIGYQKINKRTGKPVGKSDIVRGFEYEKEQYVTLSDEEIGAANPESTRTIDILAFVAAPEISFLYLDTPYFLAPDRGGDKVYSLLRDALKKSGKIGIAYVVMHSKQHLAALVPIGAGMALNTLRWSEEVRDPDQFGRELKLPPIEAKRNQLSPKELAMATRLIDDMTEPWDPDHYHDTFHHDILQLVQRKIKAGKGENITTENRQPAAPSAEILDLTALLRRSLGGRSHDDGESSAKRSAATTASTSKPRNSAGKTSKTPKPAGVTKARPTPAKTAARTAAKPAVKSRRSAKRAA